MDAEKRAAENIALYGDLAKEDKKIDAAALMMEALAQSQQAEVDAKKKRRAYLVSVGLPPFGLLYAVRYYFIGTSDGKRVALTCLILTLASLLASWAIAKSFLASAGPQLRQVQTIDAGELKDLLQ